MLLLRNRQKGLKALTAALMYPITWYKLVCQTVKPFCVSLYTAAVTTGTQSNYVQIISTQIGTLTPRAARALILNSILKNRVKCHLSLK